MGDYDTYQQVQQYVDEAEQTHGVPSELLNSVIHSESSFRRQARSEKGAMGLMQITPDVAKKYNVTDPLDPRQNIMAGAAYLGSLLELYDGNQEKALAAYHMGVTGVKNKLPGPKTRAYVKNTLENYSDQGRVERLHNTTKVNRDKRSMREWNSVANTET